MEKSMSTEFKLIEEPKKPLSMNPKKFAMWLFIATVMMLFAALTSAYIVRQAEGNWVFFELPSLFYITSVIIVLSSVTMQIAYVGAKKGKLSITKAMLVITSVFGIAFLVGQFFGWKQLVGNSIYLV